MTSTFGKFVLGDRIGGGQLSEVFTVLRPNLAGSTGIALKRVTPRWIGERDFVTLVVREAGILSRLDHPSLCRCQEIGMIDGAAFLTLEMIDGCTLRALMRRLSKLGIALPTSAVISLGAQLAQVLNHLHGHAPTPLIHLDLSPQNVMISRTGVIKLIDFGIARYLDGSNPPPLGGRMAGTVGYMSPEQACGREDLDPAADQYGLGILLWELLASGRLFRGNTPETWRRMREAEVPAANGAHGERPEGLSHVVYRMLAADRRDRFPDLAQVLEALTTVSSSPESGQRPLAALVGRLLSDTAFDPFDALPQKDSLGAGPVVNIPTGDRSISVEDYDTIEIEVSQGLGSPAAQIRDVMPMAASTPHSPFLEAFENGNGAAAQMAS
jgi:serine/threonine-protein kinase